MTEAPTQHLEVNPPSYDGRGLVNLMAEIETRLGGHALSPGLDEDLAAAIPDGETFILVVIDGLGDSQLAHPLARNLMESRIGVLEAPFSTTTTTSLSTIATGVPPSRHGVLGHILRIPGIQPVVNTLKWRTTWGDSVDVDTSRFLPSPLLWERLRDVGVEPITIQPGEFEGTPLSRMLYRGCRFEPTWSPLDMVAATVGLARPGRLILTYLPMIDVAAHVHGQRSSEYAEALAVAAEVWLRIQIELPPDVVLIGTADHGHIDYPEGAKKLLRSAQWDDLEFWGDPRSLLVSGPMHTIEELTKTVGATLVTGPELHRLWGPDDLGPLGERVPDAALLAAPGTLLLPRGFDKRLIGYHGGLSAPERQIPLLVG
ncbi:MAG: hypothetical protein GEU79_18280 [Acidimicrobiia bacterium]|nr:hypothetical protein [Acidimicrobiia bacterium]